MEGYLGTFSVDIATSEYKDYTPNEWALLWIRKYGGIDGAHHKDWVLDQVVQILNGTKVILKEAKWVNSRYPDGYSELRFDLDTPTTEYDKWVAETKDGEDGPETYGYSQGIAP